MGHVRFCYPRTLLYLVVVSTLILLLMILEITGAVG